MSAAALHDEATEQGYDCSTQCHGFQQHYFTNIPSCLNLLLLSTASSKTLPSAGLEEQQQPAHERTDPH
jgi:hypothetical protein